MKNLMMNGPSIKIPGTTFHRVETTIAEKRSNSILVTVPSTFTPSSEFLAKSSIYHTVFTYLIDDLKSPDFPLALAEWDQKKAVERIKQLITLEEKGELPWDKIAWKTDPAEAHES